MRKPGGGKRKGIGVAIFALLILLLAGAFVLFWMFVPFMAA